MNPDLLWVTDKTLFIALAFWLSELKLLKAFLVMVWALGQAEVDSKEIIEFFVADLRAWSNFRLAEDWMQLDFIDSNKLFVF